jgi:metal-dependent amidase/aminoacylase/carboxypeptidase family protein
MFRTAADAVLGEGAVVPTQQSLGGEDFGWYLESIPGALARLGVAEPGQGGEHDLHRGTFDVDERCIAAGVSVLASTALTALHDRLADGPAARWDGDRPDPEAVEGAALA